MMAEKAQNYGVLPCATFASKSPFDVINVPTHRACLRCRRFGGAAPAELRVRSGHPNMVEVITPVTERTLFTAECRACKILDQGGKCRRIYRTWSINAFGPPADRIRYVVLTAPTWHPVVDPSSQCLRVGSCTHNFGCVPPTAWLLCPSSPSDLFHPPPRVRPLLSEGGSTSSCGQRWVR